MTEQKIKSKYDVKRDLKVFKSSAGLGLITLEDIKKGEVVIEYTGEVITREEADRRGGKYLFDINTKWVVDGKGRENTARYINHSCRPNCETDVVKKHVFVSAKRNIKAGEELTYDYGKEYWEHHIEPFGCQCGKCSAS